MVVNFRQGLLNFAKEYLKQNFAGSYASLTQEEKDLRIKNILANMYRDNSEELEIEAAKLIIAGADLNFIINEGFYLLTPLMIIAQRGRFIKLISLLANYVDINAQDNHGETALIHAAAYNHLEVVKELLKYNNINLNLQTYENKYTALMTAALLGNYNIVKALLNNSQIDIALTNIKGKAAKDIAL